MSLIDGLEVKFQMNLFFINEILNLFESSFKILCNFEKKKKRKS
jgi:hypothetical protein